MNKKALLVAALLSTLLFTGVAGTQFVHVGKANPQTYVPKQNSTVSPDSSTEPPVISISSPQNNSMYGIDTVVLTFNASTGYSKNASDCTLDKIYFETDWQSNKEYLYERRHDLGSYYAQPIYTEFSETINFTGIPDGNHTIKITIVEIGRYYGYAEQNPYDNRIFTHYYDGFTITGSSLVKFSVDTTPPVVSVLPVENITCYPPEVQLNFTVNEKSSHMFYSLDGQDRVTISGNTTLSGLPNGAHNVTLYATDESGNTGVSETIYFSVNTPDPFPTVPVAAAAVVVAASVSVVAIFKKRKP